MTQQSRKINRLMVCWKSSGILIPWKSLLIPCFSNPCLEPWKHHLKQNSSKNCLLHYLDVLLEYLATDLNQPGVQCITRTNYRSVNCVRLTHTHSQGYSSSFGGWGEVLQLHSPTWQPNCEVEWHRLIRGWLISTNDMISRHLMKENARIIMNTPSMIGY